MAYHSDEFLRKRQNDPKWHDLYVQRMQQREAENRQNAINVQHRRTRNAISNVTKNILDLIGSIAFFVVIYYIGRMFGYTNIYITFWEMLKNLYYN
ncbi:hypothetical protein [Paucilactobacillus sp. N302-9]